MPRSRSFGISTGLYRGRRLNREHLRAMSAAGFDSVELSAARSHFDYHRESAIADLQEWLADARLTLGAVHAPTADPGADGRDEVALNLASPDDEMRARALEEVTRALHIARRLPFATLVVHAGVSRRAVQAGANSREAARRSVETLAERADPLGVTVAIELTDNELSAAGPLVHFVEDVLEPGAASICLDLGQAAVSGDPQDVIETVSGHIALVHAHDVRGRVDRRLVPFDGTIDWPAAVTTLQKVGYDGAIVLDPSVSAGEAGPDETLARSRAARVRIERMLEAL